MSEQPEFGTFTPAERRAALVQLTRDVLAKGAPTTYPPNKNGEAKPVKPGSAVFAAACWAKRRLSSIEFAIQDDNGGGATSSAQEGRPDDTPF